MRYEIAIPIPKRDNIAFHNLVISIIGCILWIIIGLMIVLIYGDDISRSIHNLSQKLSPQPSQEHIITEKISNQPVGNSQQLPLTPYLWLIPIGIGVVGIYNCLSFWAIRTEAIKTLSKTKIWQAAGATIVQCFLGWLIADHIGLLIGFIIGQSMGITALSKPLIANKYKFSSRKLKYALYRYRHFALISSWSAIINRMGVNGAPILIAIYYGATATGLFMLGYRLVSMPITLIGKSISQIYIGELAKSNNTSLNKENNINSKAKKLFLKTAIGLLGVGLIPIIILWWLAPEAFAIIFGQDWRVAGEYLQIIAPMLWLQFAFAPLSQTLNILERQGLQLAWDITRLISIWLSFFIAASNNFNIEMALSYFNIAMSSCYLLMFGLCYLVLIKKI